MRRVAEDFDEVDDIEGDADAAPGPAPRDPGAMAWWRALGQPLAVTAGGLYVMRAAAAGQGRTYAMATGAPRAPVVGGVAVLPVRGLLQEATYRRLGQALRPARAQADVRAVLLDINSPGGTWTGCGELAALIAAGRAQTPIAAYISGDGAAAAYVLAAATGRIDVARTATVGGLGIQFVYRDATAAETRAGIRSIEIVSSDTPRKNAAPSTRAGRANWQQVADDLAAVQLGDVARYRPAMARQPSAQWGDGNVYVGAEAQRRGLVDGLSTFDQVLARLAA